ncbi:hypothetical protein [Thermosipho sp. (in: thermotogales)]|jgi:hypothetical protein|uniref:hypothetical protein n=1 Tax=Thermosipho sp. (in: thermotogales) TaxID=1968895 RepID=UPI00257B97DA|nr:hypothetical protein [Thermosipho sp. (in: thermotogales)]MBZ4649156.1 hypothetical protein [Thermosipho sp. (in: thermotogales)]
MNLLHVPSVDVSQNSSCSSLSANLYTVADTNNKTKCGFSHLYNVIAVDKNGKIIIDTKIVADDTEQAKYYARVYSKMEELGLTFDDITIITNYIGDVKIKKEK